MRRVPGQKFQADVAQVGEICSPNMEAHFLDFTAFPFSATLEYFSSSNSSINECQVENSLARVTVCC